MEHITGQDCFQHRYQTMPETGGSMVSPGNGHILICVGPNDVADPPMPEILEYEKQIWPEVSAWERDHV